MSVLRKIAVTGLVGGVSFLLTDLIFESLPAQFAMAVGFGSVVLLIQFLVDFERRLARVEDSQVRSVDDIRRTVRDGFAGVNHATGLFSQVEAGGLEPAAVTALVRNSARIGPDTPRLVRDFARLEIGNWSTF